MGFDINQSFVNAQQEIVTISQNSKDLNFRVGEEVTAYYDLIASEFVDNPTVNSVAINYFDGDVLIGGGFGLRTIVFGLPLRWDVGYLIPEVDSRENQFTIFQSESTSNLFRIENSGI